MITRFNHNNLAANLPDAYKKSPDSNNHKILEIEKRTMDYLRQSINEVYESLDLDKATGKTLDLYGEMVGLARGKATDSQYRVLLKGRIVRNLANGDYNSIITALSATFGCDPHQLKLIEFEDSCKVQLGDVPFSVFNKYSIDLNTAMNIVKALIPVGVFLESATFSGTLEFGGTEMAYDESAGFGSIDQTIGGTLGFAFDGNTPALPI